MKNIILITVLCFTLSLSAAKKDKLYDWRGEDRTGTYLEENLLTSWPENGPELIWSVDSSLGLGYSSPIVTDEYVYIPGMIDSTGHMFCYDLKGALVWDVVYGKEWNAESFPGTRSTPLVKGNDLYMLSGRGVAVKMNAKTGDIIWKVDLVEKYGAKTPVFGFSETPLIVDDNIIFTPLGSEAGLIALKQKNGELVWKSPSRGEESAYCCATYFEHNQRKVVATMTLNYLYGVDYETGDTLWTVYSYKKFSDNCNTPQYANGELFIASPHGVGGRTFLLNEDASELTLKWENTDFDPQIGGWVEYQGYYYGVNSSKKRWVCVDKVSGETKWTDRTLKPGAIIAADDLFYYYTVDGDLALVEPSENALKIISQFKVFDGPQQFTHPVISDGKLYVRYQRGIKVFDVKKY